MGIHFDALEAIIKGSQFSHFPIKNNAKVHKELIKLFDRDKLIDLSSHLPTKRTYNKHFCQTLMRSLQKANYDGNSIITPYSGIPIEDDKGVILLNEFEKNKFNIYSASAYIEDNGFVLIGGNGEIANQEKNALTTNVNQLFVSIAYKTKSKPSIFEYVAVEGFFPDNTVEEHTKRFINNMIYIESVTNVNNNWIAKKFPDSEIDSSTYLSLFSIIGNNN